MNRLTTTIALTIAFAGLTIAGCGKSSNNNNATPTAKTSSDGHDHGPGADHSHDEPTTGAGHGGAIIELGTATIGVFSVRAARDEGAVKAGGDAPIDVWLEGSDAEVSAVRFWIGTEAGDESIKAKADIEDPAQPNHWHTHAEIPSPMPADSKLWVEIEMPDGSKQTGSFDLKM